MLDFRVSLYILRLYGDGLRRYLYFCLSVPAYLPTYLPTYLLTNPSIHWLETLRAVVLPALTLLHFCVVSVVYSAVAATNQETFDVGKVVAIFRSFTPEVKALRTVTVALSLATVGVDLIKQ